ncbi:MarR family winged helix-turn-helix transcriptional regulator [Thalassospira sp.]|uniref:MarR family winged helix-turn-helix transcriptional regulator n=1 Tax=Thalassospira sp. TaxID=1912094 RepID=UPI0027370D4A|nr:MarR family transcriptional regulator [Thalassospira sp.]MDP2700004.1 MarR family transcriptional regulator [Thalassospira sp.]
MFEQCLYFNTTSLARMLEREWGRVFKPYGLTPAQAFMLRVILAKAPISHTDLASVMNIAKATCSRTVEGLIKMGFVLRSQADVDGRSFELSPSEQALAIAQEINEASARVTQKIQEKIGPDEFRETVAALRMIGSAIG